jgi:hypothetical protein
MKDLKMIFIIPCKYNEYCLVEECVSSIKKYHPEDMIVVVDSDSEDKSYFKRLPDTVVVEDIANKNYEAGAFWYVTEKYISDYYILLQDSMILKKNIDEYINGSKFKNFINFYENENTQTMIYSGVSKETYLSRIDEMIGDFKYPEYQNENFTGVFGCNMIVSRELVMEFIQHNLNKTLIPENKFDSEIAERAFGIAAKRLGIKVAGETIIGNLHQLQRDYFDEKERILYTDVLNKKWVSQHRQ